MGGITLNQIVDLFVAAIVNDAALSQWCSETYGRPPQVLVGMDERNRPGPDDMPLVLVRSSSVGTGDESIDYKVQIDWAITDDEVQQIGNVRTFLCAKRIDDMGQLVWAAIRASLTGVLAPGQQEYVLEAVERFPVALGGMDVTINVPAMLSGHITL